jgi:hypothetical protein
MKMLLTDNGHPFSGSRLVQDLRNASQDILPRYITLIAVNNDEAPANLTVSLEGEAVTPLLSIDVPSSGPVTMLRRLPLLPGSALRVTAASSVHCFGWSELEPSLRAETPSAFFAPPRGVLLSEDAEGEVRTEALETLHVLTEEVHEVSLIVDMTDTVEEAVEQQQIELRFYDTLDAYTALVVRGPQIACRLLDGIPMRGPGRIAASWTGTGLCRSFAYGTVIRR